MSNLFVLERKTRNEGVDRLELEYFNGESIEVAKYDLDDDSKNEMFFDYITIKMYYAVMKIFIECGVSIDDMIIMSNELSHRISNADIDIDGDKHTIIIPEVTVREIYKNKVHDINVVVKIGFKSMEELQRIYGRIYTEIINLNDCEYIDLTMVYAKYPDIFSPAFVVNMLQEEML